MSDVAPETFATPDDLGEPRASSWHSSLGESLAAQAADAFMGGTRTILRASEMFGAEHGVDPLAAAGFWEGGGPTGLDAYQQIQAEQNAKPDVPIADAKARVKQEGLEGHLKLPEQDSIRGPVLDLMLAHARERAEYEAAVNRGPQNFAADALGFVTQMGAGMIDPVNVAAFSIPVLGEARYGQMLARAGDSLVNRFAVKAGVGAAQGAVGGALLAPADWWLRTQDGQDYTFADALKSVVLSAGMGAAGVAGHGLLRDVKARLKGEPLPGSPAALATAALEKARPSPAPRAPVAPLGEEAAAAAEGEINAPAAISGARPEEQTQEFSSLRPEDLPPGHPGRVLADLPPRAQEDVVRAAIANVIQDKPVNVAEMLAEAAKADPRIAESVNGGRGPKPRGPQSLLEFIAARGGINDKDPQVADFLQSFGGKNPSLRGLGKLVRAGGKTLDDMRAAAVEGGYLHDAAREHGGVSESTVNDLLDAVDSEARGQRHYPAGEEGHMTPAEREALAESDQHARAQFQHDANEAMETVLDDREITEIRKQLKARAFSIIERDSSIDPETAIRSALDEYGMGRPEDAELSADAAVRRSETLMTINGESRRVVSETPNWQSLTDERAPYDDPQTVRESKAADAAPEPASIDPEKAPSAAEAAAKDADALLADIRPNLSEEEWRSIEERLNRVADDKAAREQIARDGAACLAAATSEAAA